MTFNNIFIYTSIFFTLSFNNSTAASYYCPKLPIEVYIGKELNHDWHVWPENESDNLFKKIKYKFSKNKYRITFWGGFPTGELSSITGQNKNFIACCVLYKEGVKKICAFKTVIETNCEADLPSKGRVRYICPVKGKLKKVSASI